MTLTRFPQAARKPLFLAFLLLALSPLGAQSLSRLSPGQLAARGFKSYAQSSKLELYADPAKAFLAVRVKSSGYVWYSSPLDWESDQLASGFNKNALPSLVAIRSGDENRSIFPANGWISSVAREGLTVDPIDGGVRFTSYFPREGITIPVEATLDGDQLLLSVDFGQIRVSGSSTFKLLDFTVAPYFGAAPKGEKGYILVPDGSGAIIRFNNNKSVTPYQQYVYGRDPSISPVMKKIVTETAYLPVYGLSREGAGFLSVIEDGAARSWINAETSGQKSGYNAASASCIVRDFDVVSMREKTGTIREIRVFANADYRGERFTQRYFFLGAEDNSYSGMSKAYREYLSANGGLKKSESAKDVSLYLNFIGAGGKVKPIAGIPMGVYVPYTPFKKAQGILKSLQAKGVGDLVVKYDAWIKGGAMYKYPDRASAVSSLGGNSGMRKFLSFAGKSNIPVYSEVDPVNLYESDITHLKEVNANRAISRSPATQSQYMLTTFDIKKGVYPSWVLKTPYVKEKFEAFLKSMRAFPTAGLAPDSLGNQVSSDFGAKRGGSRQLAAKTWATLLEKSAQGRSQLLSRPCAYALGTVDRVMDLPTRSSRFDIEDEDVPFFQMVLRGFVSYSDLPGNRDLDDVAYKLSLLEAGAMPSYLLVAQHADETRDTKLEAYYNVLAADWLDEAAATYAEVAPILKKVAGAEISRHEILARQVRRTDYSNGVSVVVNYGTKEYKLSRGGAVAPRSYIVLEGAAQ
jgi:hypothetical protein